jgi:CheY-like chemotaxis protein
VLVVDDSRDAAESLALVLRLQGHEARVALDGPEALDALDAFRPDAVLLDVGLPGMDGYEVARHIRQRPAFGRTTLVAVTGYGREEDRRRAAEAGFDHHLTKPADPAVLDRLLRGGGGNGQAHDAAHRGSP